MLTRRYLALAAMLSGFVAVGSAAEAAPITSRVGLTPQDVEFDQGAFIAGNSPLSADGRYVVFSAWSRDVTPGDPPGWDAFVRDRLRGTTTLVTVPREGVPRSDRPRGYDASISANGRYVVFSEYVSDLVVGDTNDNADVFMRDLKRGVTRRVVVSPPFNEGAGPNQPTISADGRFVAFGSLNGFTRGDRNRAFDVFLTDARNGRTTRVSKSGRAHRDSYNGVVSGNGRRVAFGSRASNLVRDDSNGRPDVFVFDRITRATVRVSVSSSGAQAQYPPKRFAGSEVAISRTGRFIAFSSKATNLVVDDTNRRQDVFVRDIRRGVTERVSVRSDGGEACRGVARGGWLTCAGDPAISPDGRWVAFTSSADDLVDGDTNGTEDVFLHDRRTGTTSRISVSTAGIETCPDHLAQCNSAPAISDGGQFVAFNSLGSTLIADDTNHAGDVFLRGPLRAPWCRRQSSESLPMTSALRE